ncbi:hypothetical protein HZH66_003091 [Vespula vulgaris]|uniref:Uncharacterized protein n=1 Tax=Vespula vulgaris TaxID=7454 RepID=A0A836XM74_VESVU|nr:hypothetical protein HZH66_003091 [Vespula vulgaris]
MKENWERSIVEMETTQEKDNDTKEGKREIRIRRRLDGPGSREIKSKNVLDNENRNGAKEEGSMRDIQLQVSQPTYLSTVGTETLYGPEITNNPIESSFFRIDCCLDSRD